MKFKTSDGVSLVYDDLGEGQPVVILTGIGGSRLIWQAQVELLVALGYRVINLDARNQGASQHTAKGLRISRHALDLQELIIKLNLVKPILMGNSMGAATLFAYVSLFGDRKIQALVDVDQSPRMINTPDWPYGFKDLTWADFPEILKRPLHGSTKKRIPDTIFKQVKAEAKAHPYDSHLNYHFLVDHAFQDWRDIVRQLTVPLLVVAGGSSPFFNPAFAQVTADMAAQGVSQVIPGVGHIVMAEDTGKFNEVLVEFLNGLQS